MRLVRKFFLRFQDPIIVVSGLPRSGTSMAMKMLEAGGIEPFTDARRKPDIDNPKGYYEFERVKDLHQERDKTWLEEAKGRAVKIISYLLTDLPPGYRYQIIFLNRRLGEVMASQNKMLERRGEEIEQDEEQMKEIFIDHLAKIRTWLRRQENCDLLEVSYAEIIHSPEIHAEQIARFLNRKLDIRKMAEVVDPKLYRNRV